MVDTRQLLGNDVVERVLVLHENLTCKIPKNCQYTIKCIIERHSSYPRASKNMIYFSPQITVCRFVMQSINNWVKRFTHYSLNTASVKIVLFHNSIHSVPRKWPLCRMNIVLQVLLWAETSTEYFQYFIVDVWGRNQTAQILGP